MRIDEKVLVDQQVFVRERGERFAHLQDGPQQQPFGFLAVAVERRFRIDEAGEPRADRIGIGHRGDLHVAGCAVRAVVAIETGGQFERVDRARGGDGGFHGRRRGGGGGRGVT
ncbi:hypothetical protein OKW38_000474 [Paraburkholderia sp. MM5496-R1]